MKRIWPILLAAVLSGGLFTPAYAITNRAHFVDVPASFWAYDYVEQAYSDGVVSGISGDPSQYTGMFSPNTTLTNAQFVTILAQGFFADNVVMTNTTPWYMPYMSVLQERGLLDGTDITAIPNATATRYDMSLVMVELLRYKGISMPNQQQIQNAQHRIGDWESIPSKYRDAVSIVYAMKLISGINEQGDFAGNTGVTRAAMCTVYCTLRDAISPGSNTGNMGTIKEYYPGTNYLTYTSVVGTPLKRYGEGNANATTYIYEYELDEYGKAKLLKYSDYLLQNGFSLVSLIPGNNGGYILMKGSVGISIMLLSQTNEVAVIVATL